MSVWFCIPSCRPASEATACFDRWRGMGYKIALLRQGEPVEADLLIPTGEYLGWARSTNILAAEVLRRDPTCLFIVGGGDDTFPAVEQHATVIQRMCWVNFSGTYCVMQPTGDRWGDSESARATFGANRGAAIERFAGSPWMGREWCEKSYLGRGPMFDGYFHCCADNELQEVAIQQGVFWQRRDLTHFHNHPARADWPSFASQQKYHEGHLKRLYSSEVWGADDALYQDRKRRGFPGSERLTI